MTGTALTVAAIERRVAEIDAAGGDPEGAHVEEDNLYVDTLQAIADGADDPAALARAALVAAELDFVRWYA